MSQEPSKVVLLSQANQNRKSEVLPSGISDTDLAKIGEVIERKLDSKFARLEKSINRMASQFEALRTGESEDASLRVTTDSDASDLALADIKINPEDYYTYTASDLADKLSIEIHNIPIMVKMFGLRNKPQYHKEISTGKKSSTNKWSEETYVRLKKAIDSKEYAPKPPKIKK